MQIAYFNTLKEMKHQRTTWATNSFMIYNVHNAYLLSKMTAMKKV